MTINEYFDRVIVINLARREDRWKHVLSECDKHSLEVERFEAIDMPHWGNHGCVASHAGVLEMVASSDWNRVLILEDDFEFCHDAQKEFSKMIPQLPDNWWMFYLGGHYGDYDNQKIGPNMVRFSYMKTTSSYGVTKDSATAMFPLIHGGGPIDDLYHMWHVKQPCYILCPRICVQMDSYSDLSEKEIRNADCMMDKSHEKYLGMECVL